MSTYDLKDFMQEGYLRSLGLNFREYAVTEIQNLRDGTGGESPSYRRAIRLLLKTMTTIYNYSMDNQIELWK